jgi:hypothetical protein
MSCELQALAQFSTALLTSAPSLSSFLTASGFGSGLLARALAQGPEQV